MLATISRCPNELFPREKKTMSADRSPGDFDVFLLGAISTRTKLKNINNCHAHTTHRASSRTIAVANKTLKCADC